MSEERFQEIFRKLDAITETLNNFRVETIENICKFPCEVHDTEIKNLRGKFKYLSYLVIILITGFVGLAFKTF